jgi:hypothetical protein
LPNRIEGRIGQQVYGALGIAVSTTLGGSVN